LGIAQGTGQPIAELNLGAIGQHAGFLLEVGTIIAAGTPAGWAPGREPPALPSLVDVDRIDWTGSTSRGTGEPAQSARAGADQGSAGPDQAHRGHGWLPARHNGGVTETQTDLTDDERADRLTKLRGIIDLMRPAVQADGGELVLVRADVESGVIEVQLQGACSSCAISEATLSGGVERILRDRLPWVTDVIGGLDDALTEDESSALGSGGYVPSF
jgi:Fe-S cluster biogenesis protein NfuA